MIRAFARFFRAAVIFFPFRDLLRRESIPLKGAGLYAFRHCQLPLCFAVLAFIAAGLNPALRAQQSPEQQVSIRRIPAKIHVDGRLDEPVWSQIPPITRFLQTNPDEGAPVSEKTEAFIFYDDENLYFGFKCYDSEPDKIVARYDTHDARTNSDSVNIFIDPFGDRRTGYFFSVNARGVQFDAILKEGDKFDATWDGIWQSAARLESWGWSAEVAIPFKSIRFRPGVPWGLNLGRDIVRKNETANWQMVPRFDGFMRPSKAGTMTGIQNERQGRNLEVIPYFSPRIRRGAPNPIDNTENYNGGADIRWGWGPNLTFNATLNPDFADTEADEINIAISRYELFFPEKRTFFTEGANYFSTPFNLFYSRRIGARLTDANGLTNGQPQRILFGAKLTGKQGPWSIGLMETRTQATNFSVNDPSTGNRLSEFAPGANFFALRVAHDIGRNSSVGFLTVNRDQAPGDVGSTERVHAADLNLVIGPHWSWMSQAAYSQNQLTTAGGIQRAGMGSLAIYNSDKWEFIAQYKFLGRGFDVSQIGIEPETDRHRGDLDLIYKPFLNRYFIRQLFLELNYDSSLDTSGLLQDAGADADIKAELKNYWSIRARYSYDRTRYNVFTPDFALLTPTRIYIQPRIRFSLASNPNRPLAFNYTFTNRKQAEFREQYYGREQYHELGMLIHAAGRTKLQFSGAFDREFLLDGTPFQDRRLFITRINEQLSSKLRARILAQFNNDRHGNTWNLNSIMAYDFTARSAFIFGYNYQKSHDVFQLSPIPAVLPRQPSDLGNEFFFKLSYLFHF